MFLKNNKENLIHTVRRGSRTAATCKVEHFAPLTVICFMRGDFSILNNLNAKVKKTFLKTLKSRIWDPSVQDPKSQIIGFQVPGLGYRVLGSWILGPGSWGPGSWEIGSLGPWS